MNDAIETAAALLLIEIAFLVPRGTDLTELGKRLVAYRRAIEDAARGR